MLMLSYFLKLFWVFIEVNRILCNKLLSTTQDVNVGHRLIKAMQVSNMLLCSIVWSGTEEQIVLLGTQVMCFDYFDWKFIKNANILIFNLAAWGFCMILLLWSRFENYILASQSDTLSTLS